MSQTAFKQLDELTKRYTKVKQAAEADDGVIDAEEKGQLERIDKRIKAIKGELQRQGKLKEITFDAEDVNDPVVQQVALGPINWGGKYRGKFWAITNVDGDVVRRGERFPSSAMAKMNEFGALALAAMADLEKLHAQWRSDYDVVRKATDQAAADVKTLGADVNKGENGALAKRVKGDRDFFGDVNGYLEKLELAEGLYKKIPAAEKDFEAASHKLKEVVFAYEVDKTSDQYKDKEEELEDLKKDIESAKELFKEIVDMALNIAKQDWKDVAANAISFLGRQAIDAAYEPRLNTLKQELETLKKKVRDLKDKQFMSAIEGARAGLESASIRFENAQSEFKTALDQLARAQANARNELNESSSTAIAGKLVVGRTQQLKSIATGQTSCRRYLELSRRGAERISEIGNKYGAVGSFLDQAAKVDPAFSSDKRYAKTLELSARTNVVELDEWRNWVSHVQSECTKALQWLDQGSKGPMAPFDQAISLVKQGMSA
jgi:hypothetical protein